MNDWDNSFHKTDEKMKTGVAKLLIVKTAIDHAKEKETVVTGEDTNLLLVVLLLKFLHAPPPFGWLTRSMFIHFFICKFKKNDF